LDGEKITKSGKPRSEGVTPDPICHNNETLLRAAQAKAAVIMNVRMYHRLAEANIDNRQDAVDMARDFGASWDELGKAMGISRQSAQKRFGPHNRHHRH
jgi:hypothetical protein